MKNINRRILALLALIFLALACANPLGTPAPQSTNIETVVAATFSALTASSPLSGPETGDGASSLLPHSMYYLANDAAQIPQVYRLERDGQTVTQLTFEPTEVKSFDVSLIDGSVAYVSDNKLLNVNADGSNRSLLVDGGPVDENNAFLTRLSSPVFSPNGETIAFAYKGLNFYSIVSGQSNRVLDDNLDDLGNGLIVPRELYLPGLYSADGSKLIITLGYYEGASSAIYYPNGGALVRLTDENRGIICCGDYSLSVDGSALYAGSPTSGMFAAGLWRVDTNTGNVSTLILGDYDSDPVEAADNPFIAPDGQLYYFYASTPAATAFDNPPALQLVRSAADGVTGRTVLRPETFEHMNEALWAPDASFVIVANAQNDQIYSGGAAQLYYIDGSPMIPLVPFARNMKWGP
ncbi:MAG: PD40 domain-containing protein [Anaerolineales bacterium]|nr:PD40 domain-containing protein [Anaerolineales bacterium]